MSTRGRGRRAGEDEEPVSHERWLVSYSDMITVLMALFIVLFAISQIDGQKYVELRDSLAAGFGGQSAGASVLDGSAGVLDDLAVQEPASGGSAGLVDADEGLGEQGAEPTPAARSGVDAELLTQARAEVDHLRQVQSDIVTALTAVGLADTVRFQIDEQGLVMGLVADDVFFAPASAELTATAREVLDATGPVLVTIREQISVQGHANLIPVSGRYPTNWELSADRATQVLRRLVEHGRLPDTRAAAVGYGDTRPLVDGDSEQALATNRRVDIVILSAAPEEVRSLLPAAADDGTED